MRKTRIYIDGANLHQSAKRLSFDIDYKRFRVWLSQKFGTKEVFLFLGLIPKNASLYSRLQSYGYNLIFKQTVSVGEIIKGNCDVELVLRSVSDFYEDMLDECVVISGDGDFACLIEFFQNKNIVTTVIAPDRKYCSYLLRSKCKKIVYLDEHYHKFSTLNDKEKTPDADASA